MTFPKDFLWGAATASYQIEGSRTEDGRGECIWQRFSHTPGKVKNGDTGDIACDHLNRYAEDVALMREIGLQTYRFSVAWSRVLPTGVGTVAENGLDFYDRLVDELLKNNITPFVTLYHWDLPQALQDNGGWENPDSVKWFTDYTEVVTKALGDRVKNWITHNEPWCVAFLGNMFGVHAPGKQDAKAAFAVAHHLLISHGTAMNVIRQNVADSYAGITLNLAPKYPETDSDADKKAAYTADGIQNRWFLDPVYKGVYPADIVEKASEYLDGLDLSAVKQAAVPTDFLGINYYMRGIVRAEENPMGFNEKMADYEGVELTAMDWEVYPDGLHDILVNTARDYDVKALYVTENGAAYDEPEPINGVVEDAKRVSYLQRHFAAAEAAIAQGAPLKGYFVWSFLDNFEWAEGYTKRFGITYVDYATQKRIPKRSSLFYKDVIKAQTAS